MSSRYRTPAPSSPLVAPEQRGECRFRDAGRADQFHMASTAQVWTLAARQARYNVHTLAQITRVHIRQIERFCREELGRSPQEWLDEQRIIAARSLLLERESIKRVAMELGFKQLSHFCRQFKKTYGMTPSEFLLFHRQFNTPVPQE